MQRVLANFGERIKNLLAESLKNIKVFSEPGVCKYCVDQIAAGKLPPYHKHCRCHIGNSESEEGVPPPGILLQRLHRIESHTSGISVAVGYFEELPSRIAESIEYGDGNNPVRPVVRPAFDSQGERLLDEACQDFEEHYKKLFMR